MPDDAKRDGQADEETGAAEDISLRPFSVEGVSPERLVSILNNASKAARVAYMNADEITIVGRSNKRKKYTIMRVTKTLNMTMEQLALLVQGRADELPEAPEEISAEAEIQKAIDRREREIAEDEEAESQQSAQRSREAILYQELKELQRWCKKQDMEVSHPKVVVDIEHILKYIRGDDA